MLKIKKTKKKISLYKKSDKTFDEDFFQQPEEYIEKYNNKNDFRAHGEGLSMEDIINESDDDSLIQTGVIEIF